MTRDGVDKTLTILFLAVMAPFALAFLAVVCWLWVAILSA